MAVVRWTFTDPVTFVVYTFHMNPAAGGSPQYKKTITEETTTAGGVIFYEGSDPPKTGTVSGTVRELAHYQALVSWFNKRYPIVMEDDLGREQTIYITEFLPERQRASSAPYKHGFTMNYIVLSTTDL